MKALYEDLGPNGGSPFSVTSWFGTAVLLNFAQAPWRRNYSLAHELFHLLITTALDACGRDRVEKLADVFASALLLPSDHLLAAFEARLEDGKVPYENLVQVARELDVPIDALLWRLVNLHRLNAGTVETVLGSALLRAID